MVLLPVIFIGWAATAVATAAAITVAVSTLVPLLVLAAGFEAIFALHINVERIGRYLQVFHEQEAAGSTSPWRSASASPDRARTAVRADVRLRDLRQLPAGRARRVEHPTSWFGCSCSTCSPSTDPHRAQPRGEAAGEDLERFRALRDTP